MINLVEVFVLKKTLVKDKQQDTHNIQVTPYQNFNKDLTQKSTQRTYQKRYWQVELVEIKIWTILKKNKTLLSLKDWEKKWKYSKNLVS